MHRDRSLLSELCPVQRVTVECDSLDVPTRRKLNAAICRTEALFPFGIVVVDGKIKGDAAAVLRGLRVQALAQTAPAYVPEELIVCPCAEAAVQGMLYPPVRLERDGFLHTVVHDQIGIHETPAHLQRWAG